MYDIMMVVGAAMVVIGASMVCASFTSDKEDQKEEGKKTSSQKGFTIFAVGRRAARLLYLGLEKIGLMFILRGLKAALMWFLYKPHPIIQIAYIVIIVGAYGLFVVHGFPHLPNPYFSAIHKPISAVNFVICVSSFLLASFVNPGVIEKENNAGYKSLFYYDYQIYFPDRECSTCKVEKVARSKHCAVCDRCVSRFDHHCIWLNNCVGERNYRWFMTFLISNSIIMIYGVYASVAIFMHELYGPKKLINARFNSLTTGHVSEATFSILFQYFMTQHLEVMMVLLLCSVMGTIVVGFTIYHLHLMFTNVTTNETFKYMDLQQGYEQVCKIVKKARKTAEDAVKSGATEIPPDAVRVMKQIDQEWDGTVESIVVPPPPSPNLYNRGWWKNTLEVIFPPSLCGRPSLKVGALPIPALDGTVYSWVVAVAAAAAASSKTKNGKSSTSTTAASPSTAIPDSTTSKNSSEKNKNKTDIKDVPSPANGSTKKGGVGTTTTTTQSTVVGTKKGGTNNPSLQKRAAPKK